MDENEVVENENQPCEDSIVMGSNETISQFGEGIAKGTFEGIRDSIRKHINERYENTIRFDNFRLKMSEYCSKFVGETKYETETIKLVIDHIISCATQLRKKGKVKRERMESDEEFFHRKRIVIRQLYFDVASSIDFFLKEIIGEYNHKYVKALEKRFGGGYYIDGVYRPVSRKMIFEELNKQFKAK